MTEDFDVWIGRARDNAERLRSALHEFGTSIGEEGARRFSEIDRQMVRIGVPPNMVDMLNFAGPTEFAVAYERKVPGTLSGIDLFFPSRDDLIEMKQAAGRKRDLADIEELEKSRPKS